MVKLKKEIIRLYFVIFLMTFVFSFIALHFMNKRVLPLIINYANVQTKRVAIEVLRTTGLKEINEKIKKEKLFYLTRDSDGKIESIDFDTTVFNDSLMIVSKAIRKRLNEVERGKNLPSELYNNVLDKKMKNGIIYQVPMGLVFNNAFLSNVGPKIPVKISYSGNVGLDIKSRIKKYGIDSALIEIYIEAEVTQKAVAPFSSKEIKLISEIPIVMKVIKGSVPNYLLGTDNLYDYEQ